MVTRGLWNLHVHGKWYRWFHPPRGQSSSPDTPTTLKTVKNILSRTDNFKWETVSFPTPLHFQLDYIYTVDEDAGYFTVTRWRSVDGGLYPRAQSATLASIRETSFSTLDTLLEDVVEASRPDYYPLSDGNDEVDVQQLLESFGLKPMIPARLNELQFQLFTDFIFTWRFYWDDIFTWECSFSMFSALVIGLLRIAAWDFEVRDGDTEDLPITFSSLPDWTTPTEDVFWFHRYLIVCCSSDQIRTSVATKARDFISRNDSKAGTVHGIAISIRHVALFEISHGSIVHSPAIPLVANDSSLRCSPGFRLLAYIFTSSHWQGLSEPKEKWGVPMPTELLEMIVKASAPRDLISMVQASTGVETWYYSSIPQVNDINIQHFSFSIPCCGKRNTSSTIGVHCSVCYAWFHTECAYSSSDMPSVADKYICSACQQSRPCAVLKRGEIHQAYRAQRERKSCSVVHDGQTTDFKLRVSKPASRRPELWLIRSLGPPPPQNVDYAIYFNGVFSGLAYGFD